MGKNQYLSQVGADLVKRFQTRDPFAIADALGIEVMFCDGFGPLKGMYRVVKRNRFIFINKDLDERMCYLPVSGDARLKCGLRVKRHTLWRVAIQRKMIQHGTVLRC